MSAEQQTRTDAETKAIGTGLGFFRVSAVVAGLAMFVLILEMVLKYGMGNDVLSWWSPVHGLIFMVFAVATANLGFKVNWSVGRMIATILLACIPFVAFVEERRVVREVTPLTRP
ncbi:DUF3817 domain-containing protein [Janibacter corallicola]|uniref:DUF3817 domain-containing protein n=1 Tax=Janibacter corallicola TaxID=415212 RepID=UPI00082D24DA|nr:DUF3817 domain-containing protein [Janibacter corallicola]